jgi:hypothetical protein
MTKIHLPLVERHLGSISCPRPQVTLWVRTRFGDFVKIPFLVDTGADSVAFQSL